MCRKIIQCIAVLLLTLTTCVAVGSPAPGEAHFIATAREKADALGQQLSSTLMTAVKKEGLPAGIEMCQQAAGPIADGLSDEHWQVGRTSLKLRSQHNLPTAWAQQTLSDFAATLRANPDAPLERSQFNPQENTFTYMQGIVTQPLCTKCHGREIAPEVSETLQQRYPDDAATGYQVGDLRGAFIVTYRAE